MEKTEMRKKSIPGTRDLIAQVKQLTSEIDAVTAEITQAKDALQQVIMNERNKSPKAKILSELQKQNEERNILKGEKSALLNLIDGSKARISALRESMQIGNNGYNSLEKIEAALQELEMKLITSSITQKDEIEISNKMSSLKAQKSKMAENEANHKLIDKLDAGIKENKAALGQVISKLNEVVANITSLKEQLDKLAETNTSKSPEITKAEARLNGLKSQKEELFKRRTDVREKIHAVEEEFAKFETELLVQKSLEDQKESIRKAIAQLKIEKENYMTEQGAYDPKIFDSLIFTVKSMAKSGKFAVSIDLASQLMKYGIKIPSSSEETNATVDILNKKKTEAISAFQDKNKRIQSAIAAIDIKIEEEVEKMNNLPATDFEILKKGGVRVGNFRNKE